MQCTWLGAGNSDGLVFDQFIQKSDLSKDPLAHATKIWKMFKIKKKITNFPNLTVIIICNVNVALLQHRIAVAGGAFYT